MSMMDTKLNIAFGLLRKRNFIAKKNYLCCDTCALADIEDRTKNKNFAGHVFYNQQAGNHLKKFGDVYVAYAGNTDVIVEAFTDAGLNVEWNGDLGMKMLIKNNPLF